MKRMKHKQKKKRKEDNNADILERKAKETKILVAMTARKKSGMRSVLAKSIKR